MKSTLAERVKAARSAAGMSQPEAALAADVGLTVLRNIEQGITEDPRGSTIQRLERAFGVRLFLHGAQADSASTGRGENRQKLQDAAV